MYVACVFLRRGLILTRKDTEGITRPEETSEKRDTDVPVAPSLLGTVARLVMLVSREAKQVPSRYTSNALLSIEINPVSCLISEERVPRDRAPW